MVRILTSLFVGLCTGVFWGGMVALVTPHTDNSVWFGVVAFIIGTVVYATFIVGSRGSYT